VPVQHRCPAAASHPPAGDGCPLSDASSVYGTCSGERMEVWDWLRGDVLGLLQLGAGVLLAASPGPWCGTRRSDNPLSPGGVHGAPGLQQQLPGANDVEAAGAAGGEFGSPDATVLRRLVQQEWQEGDTCVAAAGPAAATGLVSTVLVRLGGDLGHTPAAANCSSSGLLVPHVAEQQVQQVLQLAVAQLPGMLHVAEAALQEPVVCWAPVVAGYQQQMWQQLEGAQAVRRACLAAHDLRAAQLRCTDT
jgi:hypothetical protein